VAVTFNHRFLAPDRLPDAADDVADLIAHAREGAGSLGIDDERLALWAFSGGGALLAASLRDRPPWLRAIVAYYAILDLEQPPPGERGGISPEMRQAFSAVRSLGQDAHTTAPMFIARAGLDNPWLNATIDRYAQAALDGGATIDLLNHPEGRHGFDILEDDERSRQIIRRTLAFLRDQLGN
jgi:acetyl esterase/lipase